MTTEYDLAYRLVCAIEATINPTGHKPPRVSVWLDRQGNQLRTLDEVIRAMMNGEIDFRQPMSGGSQ